MYEVGRFTRMHFSHRTHHCMCGAVTFSILTSSFLEKIKEKKCIARTRTTEWSKWGNLRFMFVVVAVTLLCIFISMWLHMWSSERKLFFYFFLLQMLLAKHFVNALKRYRNNFNIKSLQWKWEIHFGCKTHKNPQKNRTKGCDLIVIFFFFHSALKAKLFVYFVCRSRCACVLA